MAGGAGGGRPGAGQAPAAPGRPRGGPVPVHPLPAPQSPPPARSSGRARHRRCPPRQAPRASPLTGSGKGGAQRAPAALPGEKGAQDSAGGPQPRHWGCPCALRAAQGGEVGPGPEPAGGEIKTWQAHGSGLRRSVLPPRKARTPLASSAARCGGNYESLAWPALPHEGAFSTALRSEGWERYRGRALQPQQAPAAKITPHVGFGPPQRLQPKPSSDAHRAPWGLPQHQRGQPLPAPAGHDPGQITAQCSSPWFSPSWVRNSRCLKHSLPQWGKQT